MKDHSASLVPPLPCLRPIFELCLTFLLRSPMKPRDFLAFSITKMLPFCSFSATCEWWEKPEQSLKGKMRHSLRGGGVGNRVTWAKGRWLPGNLIHFAEGRKERKAFSLIASSHRGWWGKSSVYTCWNTWPGPLLQYQMQPLPSPLPQLLSPYEGFFQGFNTYFPTHTRRC